MSEFQSLRNSTGALIDTAIGMGDFQKAKEVIASYIQNDSLPYNTRETYHILKALLALPMFELTLRNRFNAPIEPELQRRVQETYQQTVNEINFLYTGLRELQTKPSRPHSAIAQTIGRLSELSFFALMTRGLNGDRTDPYTVTPSTATEDEGTRRHDGRLTGFDFQVHTASQQTIDVQVKTTEYCDQKQYRPTIIVIGLRSYSEFQQPDEISTLYEALIDDGDGNATTDQRQLLYATTQRIYTQLGISTTRDEPARTT